MVNINGQPFKQFEIQKALSQGCPFAPSYYYYYYHPQPHGQESTNQPKIKRVIMHGNTQQQIVAQYTDDISFNIEGKELVVRNLVKLLNIPSSTIETQHQPEEFCRLLAKPYKNKPT